MTATCIYNAHISCQFSSACGTSTQHPPSTLVSIHNTLFELDIEALSLSAGLRSIIKRELPSKTHAEEEAKRFPHLPTACSTYREGEAQTLIIANTTEDLNVAIEAENSFLQGARLEQAISIGKLLGYPTCCTDAYSASARDGGIVDYEDIGLALRSYANTKIFFCPLLSSILTNKGHIIRHFPCAMDCTSSITLAQKTLEVIREHNQLPLNALFAYLKSTALIFGHNSYCLLTTSWNGATAYYKILLSKGTEISPVAKLIEHCTTFTVTENGITFSSSTSPCFSLLRRIVSILPSGREVLPVLLPPKKITSLKTKDAKDSAIDLPPYTLPHKLSQYFSQKGTYKISQGYLFIFYKGNTRFDILFSSVEPKKYHTKIAQYYLHTNEEKLDFLSQALLHHVEYFLRTYIKNHYRISS